MPGESKQLRSQKSDYVSVDEGGEIVLSKNWKTLQASVLSANRVVSALEATTTEANQHTEKVINILLEDEHAAHYRFVIHPYSSYRRAWDVVTVIAVLYLCWKIPFAVSFDWYINTYGIKYFEYFLDAWFACDIILNFRTGFIHNGHCVMNPKEIMKHYLEFWFWVDILASIPFEIFGGFITSKSARKSIKMVKWFKIPRLMRLGRLLKFLRHYARYYGTFVVTFGFLFASHVAACTFVATWAPCAAMPDTTFYNKYYDGPCGQNHVSEMYWQALHWGVSLMLGVSVKDMLDELPNGQFHGGMYMLSNVWMLVGLGFVASLYANVSRILSSSSSSSLDFKNKLEKIKGEMSTFSLPENLQYRVRRYYDYLWLNHHFGKISLINDKQMSDTLRKEVAIFMYHGIIAKVPFLRNESDAVIATICVALQFQIFMPSDYVFHKGDVGRALFIITKGNVSVLASEDTADEMVQLGPGSFFGEMALMSVNGKRSRSVVAKTACEMSSLGQDVFQTIREEYPEFDERMRELVKQRQQATLSALKKKGRNLSAPGEIATAAEVRLARATGSSSSRRRGAVDHRRMTAAAAMATATVAAPTTAAAAAGPSPTLEKLGTFQANLSARVGNRMAAMERRVSNKMAVVQDLVKQLQRTGGTGSKKGKGRSRRAAPTTATIGSAGTAPAAAAGAAAPS